MARLAPLELQIQEWLGRAVQDRFFPGYAFAVRVGDAPLSVGAGGRFTFSPESPLVNEDIQWDCASLTKVIVTTPLVMRAVGEGRLRLSDRVGDILPKSGASQATIEQLLIHASGLPAYRDDLPPLRLSPDEIREEILATPLQQEPGQEAVYSCLNFITLQAILERVEGACLDQLFDAHVAEAAGMSAARFQPAKVERCAPTGPPESWRREVSHRDGRPLVEVEGGIQGAVHDPLAWSLGGVSGNAGLFASLRDLAAWANWWMESAEAWGEPKDRWTFPRHGSSRALGWDTRNDLGSMIPATWSDRSFGHTGFTGMSLCFDPARRTFVAIATNAIFPDGVNTRTRWVRHLVHSLCGDCSSSVANES